MERFVFLLFFDLCLFSGCYQRLSCPKERVKSALFIPRAFPQKVMPSFFRIAFVGAAYCIIAFRTSTRFNISSQKSIKTQKKEKNEQ